jgi:uncharacterized membrane protein YgcG
MNKKLNSADLRMRNSRMVFGISAGILLVIAVIVIIAKIGFGAGGARNNDLHTDKKRVFDNANMLSDSQEAKLQAKIETAENKIHADIVIVTINESLEEKYQDLTYLRSDEEDAYTGIRRYTESYWKDNNFGWNEAGDRGNGIIMVDNVYRESNGYVYNWVAGSGALRYSIGNNSCKNLSEKFTGRLPSGDPVLYMDDLKNGSLDQLNAYYNEQYYNALMKYVDDCSSFGKMVNGRTGWKAFTPVGIAKAIGGNIFALAITSIIVITLMARLAYYSSSENVSGKARRDIRKEKKNNGWMTGLAIIAILAIVLLTGSIFLVFPVGIFIFSIISKNNQNVERRKSDIKVQKGGFAYKEDLATDALAIVTANTLVRSYTTNVIHDTSSSGGGFSGGGGGFSGGGGGGFSGGGSHR